MNIGIFLQDLKSGGAEKIMVEYANYLARHTTDNVFLILVRRVGPYQALIDKNVKVIYLDKSKTLYSGFSLARQLILNDIDYLYTTLVNINVLSLIVGKITGTKIIIREANTINEQKRKEKRFFIKIANSLSRYLYNWCYKCIAISKSVKLDLVKHTNCDETKVHVIYNPIIIKDILNSEYKLDSTSFHIGFVSRLTYQKNIKTICNIVEVYLKKKRNITFHFFGEGDTSDLEKLIEKYDAKSKIVLHGFVLSYYSYIKYMNLFIHIPFWEGLGNSVLEVYNSGIPMILSDINSGFSELILKDSNNVHYVDPIDTTSIIKIIESYLDNQIYISKDRKPLKITRDEIYTLYRSLAI
ncbi:glycosyltransferase [Larkinella insperata]|uniref:Glycosyltransferase n=1 Tax=Larkinella insperata TaxID=332158 RepID=A0ABW3QNW3_9BACT|nr:glycosyltransferase [Larkinella insperata]